MDYKERMAQYLDKDALVAEIEKLQSEIAEEKKLHEDNSMWYNGINHGFNLTKDILNSLEVKEVDSMQEESKLSNVEQNGKNWKEEPAEIDFEKELYKAFGQVKDFTLGMQIAKRFYDMGKNSQEPVSEDLEEAAYKFVMDNFGNPKEPLYKFEQRCFKAGANWQKQQDQSTIELAEDHAMLAGMEKMKEQMMKDAVDAEIYKENCEPDPPTLHAISHSLDETKYKFMDKVKVIIIKED